MFETVVPETVAARSRKLLYETLPLSIAIHVVAAAGVLAAMIWTVEFPAQSPKLYMAYSLTSAPPPPPPPPPPPRRAQIVPVKVKMPDVAPNVIPDLVPVVSNEPEPPPVEQHGEEGGIEGGVEGGVVGGVPPEEIKIPLPPPPPPKPMALPETVEIERDAPLPMLAKAQEFPPYPPFALQRGIEDSLVVRYIIGRDGKVKSVKIIRPPALEDFARTTLDTIKYWRFEPYKDDQGKIHEVVHELTVEFKIARRSAGH
ncbi:MAG TPA: energy transducer TonB [Thermoanaerobaculia bacterium]|jgi:protein TonB